MIVLTSNGLSGNALFDAMRRHIKTGRAALVVTADHEYKEKNYHVARLTDELQRLGLQVDCFDFDCQSPAELLAYNVVELIGGNPYYLMNSIRQNSFLDVLKCFAQSRCIIGCSAGAVVLTPTLELIDRYSPEMNTVGLKDLSACHLTDIQILPHYSKFLLRDRDFEETCLQYEQESRCRVIRLNDGSGVILQNGEICVIQ